MTKDEGHWCNVFDGLAWREYAEPELESDKLLNEINCTGMAAYPEYIRIVSDIQYR